MIKNFLDSDEESVPEQGSTNERPAGKFSSTLSITEDAAPIGAQRPEAEPIADDVPPLPAYLGTMEESIAVPVSDTAAAPDRPTIKRAAYSPPSAAESIRMSGLAWSAGIMLFGSIVFMLILGWFADLLFGSSPWGIVIGMVIGAIIGFVQIFRINAAILRTPNSSTAVNILSTSSESDPVSPPISADPGPPPENRRD